MAGLGQSETIIDAEVVGETPSASFALVPLSARVDREPAMPSHAAGSELRHPIDRDRRTGAANPQFAAGLLCGRAGGL